MKKLIYLLSLVSVMLLVACGKDKKTGTQSGTIAPSKTGTTLQLVEDSIYLYAQEDYLWNTSLPSFATFNPRATSTGSNDVGTLTNEVNKLSQIAINPANNLPYENYTPSPGEAKYSFIDNGQVSTELNGTKGDFGFAPLYNTVSDLRIKYVYPGSPADNAGIKRGYRITSVNNNSAINYDGSSGTNVNFVINAIFYSSTVTLGLLRPDGSAFTATLTAQNYTVNPVLTYKVFNQGNGQIVGYVVFNSFTSDANADGQLNTAFNYFVSQGVTQLVVDLRYNGGGYVSTAEYLDNLIVPVAKSGSLMYNTFYNSTLTNASHPNSLLLNNQVRRDASGLYSYAQFDYSVAGNAVNFAKKNSLNVNTVYFIVTGSTASASELTINNLRPVVNVQLIGTTSYGKPVGFFDLDIQTYQLYIPEFYTQNSAGQGGYYTGMTPGSADYPGVLDSDDVTKDFGDPTEGLLAHALHHAQTGSFAVAGSAQRSLTTHAFSLAERRSIELKMSKGFNGMIVNKKNLKIKR
jgi:C-terminal processing protease CtpA/Prc